MSPIRFSNQYVISGKKERYVWIAAIASLGIWLLCSSLFSSKNPILQNGDIIFQSSQSPQCDAVRLATHSVYSHCGIIYFDKEKNDFFVYEAVGPVKLTPFEKWIKHGKDSKYLVKRLKSGLKDDVFEKIKAAGEKYKGAAYDFYFNWSDERIYCSELVWKIYKQGAGIEVGKLQKLKDFDLSSKEVQAIMKERYGNNVPYDEDVISPQSIAECDLLQTIADTY